MNQISKYGRSFDGGIHKKINLKNEKDNPTHNLILYQDTKQKINELKDKEKYYEDAIISKLFLQSI